MDNYSDFEKLAHVIQHGLQGFVVKNIECESTEANDLSHIVYKWVCYVKYFQILPTFSQNLTLQEAFKTAAQINEALKITEFDGKFWGKNQTSNR